MDKRIKAVFFRQKEDVCFNFFILVYCG